MNKGEIVSETNSQPSVFGLPLKYVSLVTLAVQNAVLSIVMHYSRVSTVPSETYSAGTAVLIVELLKGSISFVIAYMRIENATVPYNLPANAPTTRSNQLLRLKKLWREIFRLDCWKLSIPALLYVIQNNLQYIAAENLDAATFQVTYQIKILTTAGFSVLLLHKTLNLSKWFSLILLATGVGIVQVQGAGSGGKEVTANVMNPAAGFLAVLIGCCTSGLAGVYFEMVLKNSQTDLWIRNVQLSLFSLIPAALPVVYDLSRNEYQLGLFHGFGAWAWSTVFVQVFGGLVTALVIKYADNILKGFATSLSIVISCLAAVALFDFPLTFTFALGASVVLAATWMYNQSGNVLQILFSGRKSSPVIVLPVREDDEVMIPLTMSLSSSSSVSPTPTAVGSPREKSRSFEI
ncbi:nucleotide-sugar transporter [Thelephora terrestris]|uniref:Nucleotide-sugar transporter n=1 Tax=Thelephora terrestris TaxID=56493 RepID=A0A9P6HN60_9AGAM|nr:nucleotide-sugar transporter [Thelephora terrestris]